MFASLTRTAVLGATLLLLPAPCTGQSFDYAQALQKSMFFYEAQQSGPMRPDHRVSWRGPSGLVDGAGVGHDLTGGWYDAGDHVKFGVPMAYSATALAWGALDFREGYIAAEQLELVQAHLRHVNDYFLRCHTGPEELWGQVGNGGLDHAWWGSAEVMQMSRPAYRIDAQNPGSDLAAETAAAMAAASLVFADLDPPYSAELLQHAVELYQFADDHRGVYSDSITDAASYYNSYSGYQDELCWGAIWLYRATGDRAWLDQARAAYEQLGTDPGSGTKSFAWGISWDDKSYGCYALMARLTGEVGYVEDIERHLDYWTTGYNGSSIHYTPGGLAWLDQWGSLRYASNTAFLALYHHDIASTPEQRDRYYTFAHSQIDYALGANPLNRSYVCGFGVDPPVNPHHRTAHGAWGNNVQGSPTETRHILYGALVGGPDSSDGYSDDRANYINNEVATDYNALFSGALAKLTLDLGGTPLVDFPPLEEPVDEYVVEVRENVGGDRFTEAAVWVNNHTAWPARVPADVRFRLFVDLSEGYALGLDVSDYAVSTNQPGEVTVGPLQVWDAQRLIFFTEVSFWSGLHLWPGGQAESREEAQVRIGLGSSSAPPEAWDPTNDPSFEGLTSTLAVTQTIPMFADGVLVAGAPPATGGMRPASPSPFGGGGGPYLLLDVEDILFGHTGGAADVVVTSNLPWTVTDDQDWITVTPTSGSGDGTFHVAVTANDGGLRLGKVTVSGGNITREVAIQQGGDGTCEDPQPVVLPFVHEGAGEHCWVLTGTIDYVNSWTVDTLEINGVDFTNLWVSGDDLPDPIDGQYFIRFVGGQTWSHFEAIGTP